MLISRQGGILTGMEALLSSEVDMSLSIVDYHGLPQDMPIACQRQVSCSKLESFFRVSVDLLSEPCISEMFLMGLLSSRVLQGAVWGLRGPYIISQHYSHKLEFFCSSHMLYLGIFPDKLPIYQFYNQFMSEESQLLTVDLGDMVLRCRLQSEMW